MNKYNGAVTGAEQLMFYIELDRAHAVAAQMVKNGQGFTKSTPEYSSVTMCKECWKELKTFKVLNQNLYKLSS